MGARIVTAGTAHEGRGFAAYFDGNPFTSQSEIEEQILEWREEICVRQSAVFCSVCRKRIPEEEEVRTKGGPAHEDCAIRVYGDE